MTNLEYLKTLDVVDMENFLYDIFEAGYIEGFANRNEKEAKSYLEAIQRCFIWNISWLNKEHKDKILF